MSIHVKAGQAITPTRLINPTMVRHWKYARECATIGGGLMPGARLKVVLVSNTPGNVWVKVEVPGSDPVTTLKIAGEEYAHNFRPL